MRKVDCWLGVALILLCGPPPARAGDSWLAAHATEPVDYIAGVLERHPIVLLGEGHWIRHDVELVARLVRRTGGIGFQVLASELLPASRQAVVDELIAAERWDRARTISLLRAQAWPYEEYLEILEAAWEVNRDGRSLRVVALGPGANWRETLPAGETYDEFMARRILEAAPRDAVRVVVHLGFNHAFTRYYQPDAWSADRVLRFMDRAGNVLWRTRGERVFTIGLHPPFRCQQGERLVPCLPVGGAIDCAAARAGRPVGFDLAGSPFAELPVRAFYARGSRALELADLADGWVWQRPPDRTQAVRLIPFEEYAPGPAELAETLAHNPFDADGDHDRDSLRALWETTAREMSDYPSWRRWPDAGSWRERCPPESDPASN